MKIVLSYHAQKRMKQRKISMKEVTDTIEMPDFTVRKGEKIEAHRKFDTKDIKVIYAEDKYINVITVMIK